MDECSLNSREVKHGQGLNEEASLNDRKSRINGRFPDSIRLDVTGVKAVRSFTPQTFHTY